MKAMRKRGICMILAGVMLVAGISRTSKAQNWKEQRKSQ